MTLPGLLGLLALATAAVPGRAALFEVTVPPKAGEKYTAAAYQLWVPDGVKTIRAVIVRQHGCGRNGYDHARDGMFQALAAKHDAALLGTHYPTGPNCGDWCDPANGSGRAFLAALDLLAEKSGHPELAAAPWAIWGHSGGSIWAGHMTNRHPERVVAVWGRSHALTEYTEAALKVPTVFNYGVREGKDFAAVVERSKAAFAAYRPKGAVWAVAVDPESSHDCRNSRLLAVPFFDKMLAARLPKTGTALRPVPAAAWTGDPDTLAVAAAKPGDPPAGHWLIDEEYGKQWAEYCRTGEVTDATPPAAPTGLTVKPDPGGVRLAWAAATDLESGLKGFDLYKNGEKLRRVDGPGWEYGDEPKNPPGGFAVVVKDATSGDRFEVVAVNGSGRESPRSAAAVVPAADRPEKR